MSTSLRVPAALRNLVDSLGGLWIQMCWLCLFSERVITVIIHLVAWRWFKHSGVHSNYQYCRGSTVLGYSFISPHCCCSCVLWQPIALTAAMNWLFLVCYCFDSVTGIPITGRPHWIQTFCFHSSPLDAKNVSTWVSKTCNIGYRSFVRETELAINDYIWITGFECTYND